MTDQATFALHPLSAALALTLVAALPAAAQTATPPAAPASAPAAPRAKPATPLQRPAERPAQRPPAVDQKAPQQQQLQRVDIEGSSNDDGKRRASTAAKIVIGREEIERYGDNNLGEVLKRLPGVTTGGRPGRGGDVRMRGMGGGYTQILVNGERMPPGFALDQLPPEQVERIEIMRAPTAEHGARAIAGTINVVLREALQKRLNEVRLALAEEKGRIRPNASWTRNDKLNDNGGAYNITINAHRGDNIDDVAVRATTRDLRTGSESVQTTTGTHENSRSSLNMNARLQWRLNDGGSLSIQPFLASSKGNGINHSEQTPGINYNSVDTQSNNEFTMARINAQWMNRLGPETRVEVRGGIGRGDMKSHSQRQEYIAPAKVASRVQDDRSDSDNQSWSLNTKLSHQMLPSEHSLVGGIEAEGQKQNSTRVCRENGLACRGVLEFGDEFQASTLRTAAYIQDEWSPSKQWSAYAGLRWEGIESKSTATTYAVSNRSSVLTPLLHAVWKPDEKSRDQVRMSLTRSYRSPQLQDLVARPNVNSQYPSGANTANYADRAGNPNLKPELANGIDLAFERYLSKGGVLSANVFSRRITDLMRNVTELETVSWSSVPRWVSRPRNIGKARTQGIELEAKFRLDEFIADAMPLQIRANLSVFHSSVEGIPGPNNKLDQQPKGVANFGVDYRLRSAPVTLGASINYTPANQIQQSVLTAATTTKKRVLDTFALWNVNKDVGLRLSATNLSPLAYANSSVINTGEQMITTESGGRTFTQWQMRLEWRI
ncbi:TonB-dependent receptor plug domain-containing protein [Paucibacter sp. JuS9]|uniref:TonB-dependent receptor plug domain-containing protein n=1 Tax=Paucibacter sp. JuS9 TaxID=3228748 RepID=UPI003757B426